MKRNEEETPFRTRTIKTPCSSRPNISFRELKNINGVIKLKMNEIFLYLALIIM